jgi:hypothetical protein
MQAIKVAALTVAMTFVWAALIGLVFRIPLPFQGYVSGFAAVISSPGAVLIYGVIFRGLLVTIALALLLYWMTTIWWKGSSPRARMWLAANASAFVSVMALSTLDYIIGPW